MMWLIFAISLIGNGLCTSDNSPLPPQQFNKTAEKQREQFNVITKSNTNTNGEEQIISGYVVNITVPNVELAPLNTRNLNITHTEASTLAIDELITINNKENIDIKTSRIPTERTDILNIKINETQYLTSEKVKNETDENDIMHEISRQMNVILDIFNETNGNETELVSVGTEINNVDKLTLKEERDFMQNQSDNKFKNEEKNYTVVAPINNVAQKYNLNEQGKNYTFGLTLSDHVNGLSRPVIIIPAEYRENPNHEINSTDVIVKKGMHEVKVDNVNDEDIYSNDENSSLTEDDKEFKTKKENKQLNITILKNVINNTTTQRGLNRLEYKKNESLKRPINDEHRSKKDKKKGYLHDYNYVKPKKLQDKSFIDYNNMMVDLISRYNARVGADKFLQMPDSTKEFELYRKIFSNENHLKGIYSELMSVEPGKYTQSRMYTHELINGLLKKWEKSANRELSQTIYRQMYENNQNEISDSNEQNDVLEIKIKKLRSQMFEILLTIEQIKRFLEEREMLGGLKSKKNEKMVQSTQFDQLWKQIYFNYLNETNFKHEPCSHENTANIHDVSGSFVTLFNKIICYLTNNKDERNERRIFKTGETSNLKNDIFFKSSSISYEIQNLKSLLKTFNIIHKRFIQNIIQSVDNIGRNHRRMSDEQFKPIQDTEILMNKLESMGDITGDQIARKRRNISHIEDYALRYILTLVHVLLNETPPTEEEEDENMTPTREIAENDTASSKIGDANLETKDQIQTENHFSGREATSSFKHGNYEPKVNMYNYDSKNKQYVFVFNRNASKVRYVEPRQNEDDDQFLGNQEGVKHNSKVMETSTVQSATNRFYFYSNDYEQYTSPGAPEMPSETTTEVNKIMVELKPKRSEMRRKLEDKSKIRKKAVELNDSLEENPFRIVKSSFSLFRDYTDLMNDDADNVTDFITTDSVISDSTKKKPHINSNIAKDIKKEKGRNDIVDKTNNMIYENKDSDSNAIWQQFKNGYHFNSEGLLESVTDESEVHTIANKILLKKNTMLLDSLDYGIAAEYEKNIEITKNKATAVGENINKENENRQKGEYIIEAGTYKPYQDTYFTEYQDSPAENATETIEDSLIETGLYDTNSKSMIDDHRGDRDIRTETELGEQDNDKGNFGLGRDENFQDPGEIEDSPAYLL